MNVVVAVMYFIMQRLYFCSLCFVYFKFLDCLLGYFCRSIDGPTGSRFIQCEPLIPI